MRISRDRLRAAMWRPLDESTKADQLLRIAQEIESSTIPSRNRRLTLRTVLVAATLAAGLLGGTALAAEGTVPGDLLYPVKQLTESVRSWFDSDVAAQHRVEEVEEVVRRDRPMAEIDRRIDDAKAEVGGLGSDHPLQRELDRIRRELTARDTANQRDQSRQPAGSDPQPVAPADPARDTTAHSPTTTRPDRSPPTTQHQSVETAPGGDDAPRDGPGPTATGNPPAVDSPTPTTRPPRDG